ncbi:MAG: hypothetical protein ACTSX4_01715, partial [Candidatus Helarchaeota archaeon]
NDFEILLNDEEEVVAALLLKGRPTENITKKLKIFIKEFELQFRDSIKKWNGDVSLFRDAQMLVKIFDK